MAVARTVTRSIVLASQPGQVWTALSSVDRLGRWLGLDLDVDLRPGSLGTAVDGDGTRLVRVEAVEPPTAVAFSWWPLQGDAPPSRVDLRIEALAEGTRVTVTETALADLPHHDVPADLLQAGQR